ncbi:LPS biosynthesis protein [Candidatus Giovannonibacteria bacterium RIFCSPHIGHO2_02_FULL_46_20]|uniref:LPS biosynthesis protein n=1 Tax=Candidatus Giovannonibacteria bacterium RIFCSPHIGHO2_02_FULL_46_20 TaxID=1798338 RepID=A0A1F5WEP8_9BACT|nr:MAG: LPS biosynthesis protein [Candidatus Giovannonibacteria bacterium RIFCSPHIGHO2_02_FULL_46_20]
MVHYCTKCVYPSASAFRLVFDENGICSGCRVHEDAKKINWNERKTMFKNIAEEYRNRDGSNYDCIVPVSGGKDSYFQVHYVIKVGLRPLLVTYHGNNYLPEGEYNLERMREVFDCDHIIVRPSVETLKKLNRIAFKIHGDMNWHNHAGIETVPPKIAIKFNIPLVVWGEHGSLDLSGMFSLKDRVEYTKRFRLEHAQHGFDWNNFTDEGLEEFGRSELKEGLCPQDLALWQFPSDEELMKVGMRGIYLGNFIPWDANVHVELVKKLYNWKPAETPFERTYRNFSNLDDMHENGIHDYLKFIKFGYGRGTDHACKDIRAGHMMREEGIAMVKKYDHIKPRRDLERWLVYVGMTEAEFDRICDTFRDPRVWWIKDGEWWKDTICGEASSYGKVHLSEEQQTKYKK